MCCCPVERNVSSAAVRGTQEYLRFLIAPSCPSFYPQVPPTRCFLQIPQFLFAAMSETLAKLSTPQTGEYEQPTGL